MCRLNSSQACANYCELLRSIGKRKIFGQRIVHNWANLGGLGLAYLSWIVRKNCEVLGLNSSHSLRCSYCNPDEACENSSQTLRSIGPGVKEKVFPFRLPFSKRKGLWKCNVLPSTLETLPLPKRFPPLIEKDPFARIWRSFILWWR